MLIGGSSLLGKGYIGNLSATGGLIGVRSYADGGTLDKMIGIPDGGFLVVSHFNKMVYITKFSADYSRIWQKVSSYTPTVPTMVINTPDGGYLVGGYFDSSFTDTPEVGWVTKLDGDVIWDRLMGNLPITTDLGIPVAGSINAMQSITDVIVSADGTGYALVGTGFTGGSANGVLKTALLKLNSDGSFRRARSIDATATRAYITLYRSSARRQLYAVGNSSLQNGVDPKSYWWTPPTNP